MKKTRILVLTIIFAISLCACGSSNTAATATLTPIPESLPVKTSETSISDTNEKNAAAYIYELNGNVQGNIVATLTWDDTDELIPIINLVNEAYDSDLVNPDVEMEYMVELVNSDIDNDFFQIGFVDGMVCCTGSVQGLEFDHSISTTITESDLITILNRDS